MWRNRRSSTGYSPFTHYNQPVDSSSKRTEPARPADEDASRSNGHVRNQNGHMELSVTVAPPSWLPSCPSLGPPSRIWPLRHMLGRVYASRPRKDQHLGGRRGA